MNASIREYHQILIWINRSHVRYFSNLGVRCYVFLEFAAGSFIKSIKNQQKHYTFFSNTYSCRGRIGLHLLMYYIYIALKLKKLYDFKVARTPLWCSVTLPCTVTILIFFTMVSGWNMHVLVCEYYLYCMRSLYYCQKKLTNFDFQKSMTS